MGRVSTSGPPNVITVGIAGGTGSGKTTLAKRLYQQLGQENVAYLVHDHYYKDITHLSVQERAKTNFDHPSSLDTELLVQHVRKLKQGKSVQVPNYDFATHARTAEVTHTPPRKIVLVEGILLFSDADLVKELDVKIYIHADADIRFIRRLERDIADRGRTVPDVIHQYQETVRPMHQEFVEPSKQKADIVVSSNGGEGDGMEKMIKMILNSVRVEAGLTL